jgi:hypothetical protein
MFFSDSLIYQNLSFKDNPAILKIVALDEVLADVADSLAPSL